MSDSEGSESNTEDLEAIVIDNGSYETKVGWANEDVPRDVFPTIIGRPKFLTPMLPGAKNFYVAEGALSMRGILNLTNPIQGGVVQNWDDMEKIWHHAFFNVLRVCPEEHDVLLTDSVFKASDREKMTEIMFETFNISGLYISLQALLAWYYAMKNYASIASTANGIVVDVGYEATNIIPIQDGKVVTHGHERLDIGGKKITEFLVNILSETGYSYNTSWEKDIVNDMKEKYCYVGLDYSQELEAFQDGRNKVKHYEMPEGTMLPVENQQVRAPEILFKPTMVGYESVGLSEKIRSCMNKCASLEGMTSHILLSGGSSRFSGLSDRLKKDLDGFPELGSVRVVSPNLLPISPRYITWAGGAAFTSQLNNQKKWITKEEYHEQGATIVLSKC